MNRYKLLYPLGDGTYGNVFKAINKITGEQVALKQMKQTFNNWNDCTQLREIQCLKKLIHPNIIRLKEVIREKEELFFCF